MFFQQQFYFFPYFTFRTERSLELAQKGIAILADGEMRTARTLSVISVAVPT